MSVAISLAGCHSRTSDAVKPGLMGWRPISQWSGRNSMQTEGFSIGTGQWRVKWKTMLLPATTNAGKDGMASHGRHSYKNTAISRDTANPVLNSISLPATAVKFKMDVHSLVSGRWVATAADETKPGEGVFYLAEEPRQFFLEIESSGLEWHVEVEEGTNGTAP